MTNKHQKTTEFTSLDKELTLGYIFWTRTIELSKRLKGKKAIGTAKTASKVFAKKKVSKRIRDYFTREKIVLYKGQEFIVHLSLLH